MAQFIINLNASMPPSERFIVHMLDPTHMFVQPHVAQMIRSKIGEFRDQNSYEKPQWSIIPPLPFTPKVQRCVLIIWLIGWRCHAAPMVIWNNNTHLCFSLQILVYSSDFLCTSIEPFTLVPATLCGADKLWLPALRNAVVNSTLISEFFRISMWGCALVPMGPMPS